MRQEEEHFDYTTHDIKTAVIAAAVFFAVIGILFFIETKTGILERITASLTT